MARTHESMHGADSQLAISFFGQASVRSSAGPIKFAKRNSTIALLARVILQRGKALSRESLAYTLFPNDDEATAIAELRRYLYLASKALPPRPKDPWLIVDVETVRWNDDAGAFVDIFAFEQLAKTPKTQIDAIDLYRGDLLEDNYDEWVAADRERLRNLYLTILADSLERFRSQRAFPSALACAMRILQEDPWREDTVRAVLGMRYESGDAAGALAIYEEFAKRLRAELGTIPMPETIAVRQAIVANAPLPGSSLTPIESHENVQRAVEILPFIARHSEFATLRSAWNRAARGTGTFVLLRGEAGIGKTRLCAELTRSVEAEGGRVFVGTTAAPESAPYQALVEALRSALPILMLRPPNAARRSVLGRILPEIRVPDAATNVKAIVSAEGAVARLHDALADAMRLLSSPRPLLLVLEDLHWAGTATIEALGEVFKDLVRAPVLIIGTCRDEHMSVDHPLRTLLRSLATMPNVAELELKRFAADDVTQLVDSIDVFRDRSEAIAQDLYVHSEGNALFLNELIRDALETGHVAAPLDISIGALVSTRTAQLSEHARAVAEISAVAGSGCSVGLARDVSNLTHADIAAGFDELLDRRILREAGVRMHHDYVFTHHLIAEAIYSGIDPAFRAQRHARMARVLEANVHAHLPASTREIARHHERAGDPTAAATWYVAAAREASSVHAYADAIALATEAIELAPCADTYSAIDLRERAYGRRGDRLRQRADIDELERIAQGEPSAMFDVLTRRANLERTLGESDAEGRVIEDMRRAAESLGDMERARALLQTATYFGSLSRPADALDPAHRALSIYERFDDVNGQLECLYLLVDFTANIGDVDASQDYLSQMHARAATVADHVVEARAFAVAAQASLLRQDYRSCVELSTQALKLQLATNDRDGEASTRGRIAVAAAWLADFPAALREFSAALETYGSIGNKRGLALTHTNRTLLLMRLGLFHEALASIASSNELFSVALEKRTVVANQVNESFVRLQLGFAREAKQLAASALGQAKEIGFPIFEAAALANLGNAERALGNYASAIASMERGLTIREPLQDPRDFVDDLADLTLAYAAAGRDVDALAVAERLSSIGSGAFEGALWPHYIRWAVAQGLRAGGAHARADEATVRAKSELATFVSGIDDQAIRAAFLAVPINQIIANAP